MMQVCRTEAELRQLVNKWKRQGERVGFVPTMGNLHTGHISLVKLAAKSSDRMIVSIFVNPMQFNNPEDLDKYPRTLEDDKASLDAEGVDLIFMPEVATIYPEGMQDTTRVDVPGFFHDLEGEHRPGHFSGVATIVCKLFNLVRPDVAVFGKKDYQQWLLIKKMVRDLNMPIDVIAGETKREENGLAMSSRNNHLSADDRDHAGKIYETLKVCAESIKKGSDHALIKDNAIKSLKSVNFEPEYIDIREQITMKEAQSNTRRLVVLIAARIGSVRLIDNLELTLD